MLQSELQDPTALLLPHYPDAHCYLRRVETYNPRMGEMCAEFLVRPEHHLHRHPEIPIEWVMGLQSGTCLEQLAYILILRLFIDGQMGMDPFTPEYFTKLKGRYLLKTSELHFICKRPLLRGYPFPITMRVEGWGPSFHRGTVNGMSALCSVKTRAFEGEVTFFAPTPQMAQALPMLAANRPKSTALSVSP